MTTDITELAPAMKAAAEKATPGEWRRAATQFNGITATPFMLGRKEVMIACASEKRDAEFIALANPANVKLLVEALEKSRAQSSKWLEAYYKAVSIGARYEERIAELESRTVTVKLPDIMPPEAVPAHYWGPGESIAYADGYNKSATDLKTSFAQACSSVGVNVEFE